MARRAPRKFFDEPREFALQRHNLAGGNDGLQGVAHLDPLARQLCRLTLGARGVATLSRIANPDAAPVVVHRI